MQTGQCPKWSQTLMNDLSAIFSLSVSLLRMGSKAVCGNPPLQGRLDIASLLPGSRSISQLRRALGLSLLDQEHAQLCQWWHGMQKANGASVGSVYTGWPFTHLNLMVDVRRGRGSGRISTEWVLNSVSLPCPVLWLPCWEELSPSPLQRGNQGGAGRRYLVLLAQGSAVFLRHYYCLLPYL